MARKKTIAVKSRSKRSFPAPTPWATLGTNIVLWHGTVKRHATTISQPPYIDPNRGRAATDFGRGFYTTTIENQARQWARKLYEREYPFGNPFDPPVILKFRVPLQDLAQLKFLSFVRGDPDNEMLWSLIQHCRASTKQVIHSHLYPGGIAPNDWYDMVCGPVAKLPLAYRTAIGQHTKPWWYGMDQYSFHTVTGAGILSRLIQTGNPHVFEVLI